VSAGGPDQGERGFKVREGLQLLLNTTEAGGKKGNRLEDGRLVWTSLTSGKRRGKGKRGVSKASRQNVIGVKTVRQVGTESGDCAETKP